MQVKFISPVDRKALDELKAEKVAQLNEQCTRTILGRFKSLVGEVEYEFSYDMEAQSRFNGTATSFSRGYITLIEWTAYLKGQRTSVVLDEAKFDVVAQAALIHCNNNIAKFRELLALVNKATTKDELFNINW